VHVIIDPKQTVPQVSTNPTFDARVQSWYQAAISASGQMITTDPFYDSSRDVWLVTMALSLVDSTGATFGVVGITVTTTSLRVRFSPSRFSSSRGFKP
jgi:hypothetical protein